MPFPLLQRSLHIPLIHQPAKEQGITIIECHIELLAKVLLMDKLCE